MKIVSLKEATKRELQESKTAEIENITQRENRPDLINKPFQRGCGRNCGYCNRQHPPGRKNFSAAADVQCHKCNEIGHYSSECRSSAAANTVNQVQEESNLDTDSYGMSFCPTFVGGVTTPDPRPVTKTSTTGPAEIQQYSTSDSGWHIKLKIQDQELSWYIDTRAQVSVMSESTYKESYGHCQSQREN